MKWHKGYSGCFGYENWQTRNNDDVMEVGFLFFVLLFFLNLLLKELFSTSFVYKYKTYMPKWQTQMICWSVWCIVWTKFCFDVSLKAKIDFFFFYVFIHTVVSHWLSGWRWHPFILLCPHGDLLPAAEKRPYPPCLPGPLGKLLRKGHSVSVLLGK